MSTRHTYMAKYLEASDQFNAARAEAAHQLTQIETLTRQRDSLLVALQKFVDLYPVGTNPALDMNYSQSRVLLTEARIRSDRAEVEAKVLAEAAQ